MPTQTGVKGSESPTDDLLKAPASGGGKNSSLETLEEIKAKNAELTEALKKKDAAIEDLRGKQDEMREQMESRLSELQDKSRLTVHEENEMVKLEREIAEIDGHQYGRALSEKVKRVSNEVSTEKMTQVEKKIDFNLAKEWVEEKADDLGLDPKKFEESLVSRFAGGRWADKPLRQRVKLAWKEIQAEDTLKKEREDLEKKKIEFAETGGRMPRSSSHQSAVDLAKEGKTNDALDAIYNAQINEQRKLRGR